MLLLYAEFLAKEPAPEQRLEYGLANLTATLVNVNRDPKSAARPLTDFVLFKDPWAPEAGADLSDLDRKILERFRAAARSA